MKVKAQIAQILQTRTSLNTVNPSTQAVVIGFRPGIKDLLAVVRASKAIRTIYVAPSYYKTLSKSAVGLLAESGVTVKPTPLDPHTEKSAMWGHRTDVDGYVEIEDAQV